MSVSRKLARAAALWSKLGTWGLLAHVAKRVFPSGNFWLSWDRRTLFVLQAKLDSSPDSVVRVAEGVTPAVLLSPAQCLELSGVNHLSRASIEAALARGESCFCLREEQTVVGYVWVSSPSVITSDTGYRFPLPSQIESVEHPPQWWRDVYVDPAFRGQGRIQQLYRSFVQSLGTSGSVMIYSEIDPSNTPSLHAHARLGFQSLGSIGFFCILGARFYFCRGSHFPAFQFRFAPRNLYLSAVR